MLFLMLLTAVWLKHFHGAYAVSFYNVISFNENVSLYDVVGLKVPLSLMVARRRFSNFFKVFLVKQIQLIK